MLERLAAWVLNTYLGEYLEDLNTDQLSIGLLKGAVELEGLPLKKDALRKLDLPLEVKSGFVGKISLNIPLTGFASQPWVINMDRLYVVAGPAAVETDVAAKDARQQERKARMLNELETLWQTERKLQASNSAPSSSASYWLSFGSSLVYNVIENLQLIVSNVHIRYEDKLSNGQQYAFGVTIHQLSAQSTDENWVPKFVSCSSNNLMRKLVDLNEFAIYWNTDVTHCAHLSHQDILEMLERGTETCRQTGSEKPSQYLLEPVSGRVRLQRNTSSLPLRSPHSPRLRLDASFDQFSLALEEDQYRGLLNLLKEIERHEKRKLNTHPRPAFCVRDGPRLWWIFAQHNVLHTIKEKNRRLTLPYLLKRCRDCCDYVGAYKAHLCAKKLTATEQTLKADIEREFTYNEIRLLREVATDHLKRDGHWYQGRVPSPTSSSRFGEAQSQHRVPSQPEQVVTNSNQSTASAATASQQLGRLFSWAWGKVSSGSSDAVALSTAPAESPPAGANAAPTAAANAAPTAAEVSIPLVIKGEVDADERDQITLTDAERQQLEQEIQDVLGEVRQESTSLLMRDVVFAELNFTLGSGSFALKFSDGDDEGVVKVVCDKIKAGLVSQPRTRSMKFSLSLGGMYVRDLYNKKTLFPDLVAPRSCGRGISDERRDSSTQVNVDRSSSISDCADEGAALFSLLYELRPPDVTTDHRLLVYTKPLDIVYNEAVIRRVKEFFIPKSRPHLGSAFGSELDLAAKALRRYEELKDRTKTDIQTTLSKLLDGEQALMTARRWQVSLDISAPQIVVPNSCASANGAVVVFDLGRIQLYNARQSTSASAPVAPELSLITSTSDVEKQTMSHHVSLYFDSEENFVTPCSTPPADYEAEKAMTGGCEEDEATTGPGGNQSVGLQRDDVQLGAGKSVDPLSLSMYHRLYERYTLTLSDAQVMVGALHTERGWLQASQRGSSPQHILDKFTVAFEFDRRLVLSSDPQYPAIKVGGSISTLRAHLTESKVRALSGCADLLLGPTTSPKLSRQHTTVGAHQALNSSLLRTPGSERGAHLSSSLLEESKLTTLNFAIKELSVDVQSRGRCIAELQVSEAVVVCQRKPRELNVAFTVQTLLVVDALQTYGPDFELLVASHRSVVLDSRSGSLLASHVGSPVSPSSPQPPTSPPAAPLRSPGEPSLASPDSLSGGTFAAFQNALLSRMHKLLAPTGSGRESNSGCKPETSSCDRPQSGHAQECVSCAGPDCICAVSADSRPLIEVTYRMTMPKLNQAGPRQHDIDICFNSLELVANQGTIVEILRFFHTAFPRAARAKPPCKDNDGTTVTKGVHVDPIRVSASFNRLNVLLMCTMEKAKRIIVRKVATATLSRSRVDVTLGSCNVLEGHIGGLQLVDVSKNAKFQRIFSVGHDPVTSSPVSYSEPIVAEDSYTERRDAFYFYYNDGGVCPNTTDAASKGFFTTEVSGSSNGTPELQPQTRLSDNCSCLRLKLGSMEYLHNPDFLLSLTLCARQFRGYLDQLALSLKTAASDIAMSIVKKHANQLPTLNLSSPDLDGANKTFNHELSSPKFHHQRQELLGDTDSRDSQQQPGNTSLLAGGASSVVKESVVANGYLRLDVDLDTPIIMLPRSPDGGELLVAHLGRMTVSNSRTVRALGLISTRIMDRVLFDVADIKLFTAMSSATSEACSQYFIIDDAAVQLAMEYHHLESSTSGGANVTEFVLNSEDYDDTGGNGSMLEIKGAVRRSMQISLSRNVCEQIKDTIVNLTKTTEPSAPEEADKIALGGYSLPPESAATAGIDGAPASRSAGSSLSALQIDDDGEEIVAAAASAVEQVFPASKTVTPPTSNAAGTVFLPMKAMFTVENLRLLLRGDLGDERETSIVDITFSDFLLSGERSDPYVTVVEIRLHGFHVRDCLQPGGTARNLLITSNPRDIGATRNFERSSYLSTSCPDPTISRQPNTSTLPSSFPEVANVKSAIVGLCGPQPRTAALRKRPGALYPTTPPSSPANERAETDASNSSDSGLAHISLVFVNPSCPDFTTEYDKATCLASIVFNSLEVVVNLETWVVLLDFFGIGAKVFPETSEVVTGPSRSDPDKIKITLEVSSLALTLNKPAYPLARASVEGLSTVVVKSDDDIHLKGTLDRVSVADLSPHGRLYPQKLSTFGHSALVFDVLKYSKPDPNLMRSFDVSVALDLSSVCYTHTKRFCCELLNYFQDFNDHYDALGHMRAAAAGQKVPVLGGRSPRILLRICAATPIILLPHSSSSTHVLIVYLGNLLLENRFLFAGQEGTLSSRLIETSPGRCSDAAPADRTDLSVSQCSTADLVMDAVPVTARGERDCMTQSLIGSLEDDVRCEELVESVTVLKGQQTSASSLSPCDDNYCCLLDVMNITLSDMDLYSGVRFNTDSANTVSEGGTNSTEALVLSDYVIQKDANHPLKEKCVLKLVVERNLDNDMSHNSPELAIHGILSSVSCAIDSSQYKLVYGILDKNLGEDMPDLIRLKKQDPKIQTVLSGKVYRTVFFDVDMHNVSLELRCSGGSDSSNTLNDTRSVAKLDLINSRLTFEGFSNQSKNIDLVSKEIRIIDTRYLESTANMRPNRFVDILQPSAGDKQVNDGLLQAELHFHSSAHGPPRLTILLNNMRVMAVISWWVALKEFFVTETSSSTVDRIGKTSRDIQSAPSDNHGKPNHPLQIKLNLNNTEMVLLEDPSTLDSSGVILRATVALQYSPDSTVVASAVGIQTVKNERLLSCSVHDLELFSCCLAAEESTAMSIIDPVSVSLEMCKSQTGIGLSTATDLPRLEISLTGFIVRLSYTDLLLFRSIAKSFTMFNAGRMTDSDGHTVNAQGFDVESQAVSSPKVAGSTAAPHSILLEAALVASVELKADSVCLCFIDDCGTVDIPLVELRLKDCIFTQHMYSQFGGDGSFVLDADCYNRMLCGWEPLLETWRGHVSWSLNLLGDNDIIFKVKSDDIFNVNVTNNLLDLLRTTKAAWVDDYSKRLAANQKHHTDRSKMFTPYRLKNLTGCTVWLLPYVTDDGASRLVRPAQESESSVTWNRVEHDEEIALVFFDKDKLRHQNTHEPKNRHLCVRIDGYHEITPIGVDAVGAFYRMAKPAEKNTWLPPARVLFEVRLEKNAFKVITVRSSLAVVNSLSESVEVKLESLVQNGMAKSLQLDPGKWLPVPLRLAFCRIWVRPAFWDLPFCSQPIEWHRDLGDESAWTTPQGSPYSGPRVCQAQQPRQGIYRFCVSTRSDSYPGGSSASTRALLTDGRACAQPAHTVVLLPPLTLVNLLPLEVAYYVRGSEACGKIASGSSASLFTVNVAAAVELGITLENYPTCRELVIPSGSTEYKCRMQLCDSKDRVLYVQAYVRSKKGGGALKVTFSAPYWLVNRSGLPLVFRQDGTRVETAGQFDEHEMARSVAPLPFCFPDRDAPALCTMRLGKSVHGPGAVPQWCHSYVLENGVTVRPLYVTPSDNRPDWVYNIGIEVHQGTAKYADTRFVTFTPRFQLSNQSSYRLAYCQKYSLAQDRCNEEAYLTALPKSSLAFHWPRVDFDQLLCIRIVDDQDQWQWSGGFRIDTVNSFYLNIRAKQGPSVFLHVEVILHGATYMVVLADASYLPPPMRIDNRTEVSVRFWQANSGDERLKTVVRPGSCVAYAWDEPTLEHCLLCTVLGTGAATVGTYNIDVIGEGEQLQYENFIYLALNHTFNRTQVSFDSASYQELVLDVINGNQVILNRKEVGKRSQLWRMTSSGMIEHEGSSVPRDLKSKSGSAAAVTAQSGYVLDIGDIAVLPNSAAQALMLQKPNPRRQTTQRWMFTTDGRLVCGAEGRCVQAAELRGGSRVLLGAISACSAERASVEPQRMLPGSGVVSVSVVADGPTRVVRLSDFHRRPASTSGKVSSTSSTPDTVQSLSKGPSVLKHRVRKNIKFMCIMPAGVGLSIVNSVPEELVYASLSDIYLELSDSTAGMQLEAKIGKLQADNQLLSSTKPVLLAVAPTAKKSQEDTTPAFYLSFQKLPSQDYNCTVFKYLRAFLKPVVLSMEEVLLWKLAAFFGLAQSHATTPSKINDMEHELQRRAMFMPQARRYYFELLSIVANQICLSMTTTSGLSPDLKALKRRTGIPLISFEDAKIELDPFVQKYLFETQEFLANVVLCHFKGEIQRQAGKILGSVNFLGNPLGLFNDVANGLNSLIVDGSVGGLVKNVAHGASDSLAKVAGTLAQGIGRLALDDDHERSRVALRQRQREDGVVAGFLGLGHGIFGGLTSFVSQTYDGAMRGGVEGLFTGMAKGMVGTVAKPVAGILDFASGAASAVRDTSRGQQRQPGERAREPRCCCGGGCGTTWLTTRLLRPYRKDRSLIQRDLFHMVSAAGRGSQGPGPSEKLLDYLELQQRSDSDGLSLSCLITDYGVHIINGAMTVNSVSLSVKYSELISCSYIERPTSSVGSTASKPRCYIELRIRYDGTGNVSISASGSSADDAVRSRAPQFRCDTPSVCTQAVNTILLAKAQYDDRMYAVTINTELPEGDSLPPDLSSR